VTGKKYKGGGGRGIKESGRRGEKDGDGERAQRERDRQKERYILQESEREQASEREIGKKNAKRELLLIRKITKREL
jgi:hypothetical protein